MKGLVDGAPLWQLFKENPLYFYHNCRKITDLQGHIQVWREQGVDFKPGRYDDYVKRTYKKARRCSTESEDGSSVAPSSS